MPLFLFVLGVLAGAAEVLDQDAVPGAGARWLAEGKSAYDELRLDEARIALDRALRDPSNDARQLREIFLLQALVEASMGQPVAAKQAFSRVLVLQPEFELLEDTSPKIRGAFEAARASLPGERGLLLESLAPEELRMGEDAVIAIRLNDTVGLVAQIEVTYQIAGGEETTIALGRQNNGVLRIPAAALVWAEEPYEISLRAVARNAYGAQLTSLDAGAPGTRIAVVPQLSAEARAWYEHWWLWASAAGGVALAAAGVGIGVWLLAPVDTSPRDIGIQVE